MSATYTIVKATQFREKLLHPGGVAFILRAKYGWTDEQEAFAKEVIIEVAKYLEIEADKEEAESHGKRG